MAKPAGNDRLKTRWICHWHFGRALGGGDAVSISGRSGRGTWSLAGVF